MIEHVSGSGLLASCVVYWVGYAMANSNPRMQIAVNSARLADGVMQNEKAPCLGAFAYWMNVPGLSFVTIIVAPSTFKNVEYFDSPSVSE